MVVGNSRFVVTIVSTAIGRIRFRARQQRCAPTAEPRVRTVGLSSGGRERVVAGVYQDVDQRTHQFRAGDPTLPQSDRLAEAGSSSSRMSSTAAFRASPGARACWTFWSPIHKVADVKAGARTGRPRKFDAEQVVDAAMEVFWGKGFRSTSVDDLARATGVLPGSLHSAFGGKQAFFQAALLRYRREAQRRVREVLEGDGSPRERLRQYMDRQVDLACGAGGQHGCLMAKTALELAPADESVTPIVRENFAVLRAALAKVVRQGQEVGEFGRRWEPGLAAGMLLAVVEGFQVLGRCEQPETLRRIAESTLESLA